MVNPEIASRQQVYQERVASMLATLGRREEAIKAADAILAKDPKNQFARALKVQVLEQMGGTQNLNAAADLATDLAKEAPDQREDCNCWPDRLSC